MIVSGLVVLSACAPKNFKALDDVANDTKNSVGCSDLESKTWDAVDKYLIEQKSMPTSEELKEHLRSSFRELKTSQGPLSAEKVEALSQNFDELFDILLTEAPQLEKVQDSQGLLEVLTALEIGDHTTDTKVKLQNRVGGQFAKIKAQISELDVQCANPPAAVPEQPGDTVTSAPDAGTEESAATTSLPLPIYGSHLAMATAYQTCQALTEPIMTASTPDIEDAGIVITGTHSDGVGKKRVIGNTTAFFRSHPYYKNVTNYASSCLNGRSYPMIYDYGGKPYATTSTTSTLDFFKNAGSGTAVLGMDCSGFIYTALATAGLRVSDGKAMKASGVSGVSSTMYVEPAKNGLTCLDKITVTPKADIKSGDIVAIAGHVIMIDRVGADPFGLNGAKTTDACSKLEAKNFDFSVIQSSPSKNAVGINRYEARNYLYENTKMKDTLTKYAYYACLARVNNKNYTPSLGTGSVVRHKLTPSCMGTRIKLAQESCVMSCPQLVK